jgi:spore germination cell wall hydrolase CwlJ-like protein
MRYANINIFSCFIILLIFIPLIVAPNTTAYDSKVLLESTRIPQITLDTITVRNYSQKDYNLLCRLVNAENRSEPFESDLHVAYTVLYKSQKEDTSISNVIYGKNNYYAIYNRLWKRNKPALEKTHKAVDMVLKGYVPEKGIAYFIGDNDVKGKWYKYIKQYKYEKIGYHTFCYDPHYINGVMYNWNKSYLKHRLWKTQNI